MWRLRGDINFNLFPEHPWWWGLAGRTGMRSWCGDWAPWDAHGKAEETKQTHCENSNTVGTGRETDKYIGHKCCWRWPLRPEVNATEGLGSESETYVIHVAFHTADTGRKRDRQRLQVG